MDFENQKQIKENFKVLQHCHEDAKKKFEYYKSNPNSTFLKLYDWTRQLYIIYDEKLCWYNDLSSIDKEKERIYKELINNYNL